MTTRQPEAAPVESPSHVHPTRMRHISDADLAAALGRPGASVADLRAGLDLPRPVWDPAVQARGLGERQRTAELAAARELVAGGVDFLDAGAGRSGLYGRHYLNVLRPLVHGHELTGDEAFPAAFDRIFTDWYASRDHVVGDWPGLDVVWYSLGVWARAGVISSALASFGTSPALRDTTWAAMLKTLVGGARWSAEEHVAFRHGNWQLVCAAELLHLAAYLPGAPEADEWAATGWARVVEHLDRDFYPDGGHHERSPGYHSMCLEALQRAAVVSELRLDRRLDTHPRFRAAHTWLATMTTPSGWVPPWQDSGTIYPARQLLRGAHLLGDHALRAEAETWLSAPEATAELALLPPRAPSSASAAARGATPAGAAAAGTAAAAPDGAGAAADTDAGVRQDRGPAAGSVLLAESGYAVLRGPAPASLYMAVNVGPYVEHELESHSHFAVTDFVVSAYGAPLAIEAGGPATYDDPRYQDWYRAPRAHNTVTLPGEEMRTDRRCVVEEFTRAGAVSVLRARHDGYSRRIRRSVVLVAAEPGYWLVSDRVAGEGPAVWSLLGPEPWGEEGEEGEEADRFRGGALRVVPAGRAELEAGIDTGPGQIPGRTEARHGELHALRLRTARGRFDVLLAPAAADDAPPWRLEERDGAWRISDGTVVDTLRPGRWERRDAGGALLDSAEWERK